MRRPAISSSRRGRRARKQSTSSGADPTGGIAITRILAVLILAVGALARPLAAEAQQERKIPLIGVLAPGSAEAVGASPYRQQFAQALRDFGWIEGKTVLFERRYAEGNLERLPELAAELVRLKVDVIYAATGSAAVAAMRATQTIPIVMQTGDAFSQGLVTNLARPDKNVTGQVAMSDDIAGKRLELLKEALPRASRVAVLRCSGGTPRPGREWPITQDAARALKIQLLPLEVRSRDDLQMAFAAAVRQHADGLVVGECPVFNALPAAMLVQHRLPAIYIWAPSRKPVG